MADRIYYELHVHFAAEPSEAETALDACVAAVERLGRKVEVAGVAPADPEDGVTHG